MALLLAVFVTACGNDPVGPAGGQGGFADEPPLEAPLELQVAADETVAEAMIEDAALWVGADAANGPWAEARELFRLARRAWRAGDTERAAELAREGRLVLARAFVERRGEEGLDALEGHVEAVIGRLDEASDDYARAEELAERLADLLAESRRLRAEGDLVEAAERLILALGITDRLRHRMADGSVAEGIATRAVASAGRIHERVLGIVGSDRGPRVRHALAHARELLRRADAALEREAWRRAVVLARRSIGWSLHALRIHLA
ncbi:MAG: hypothetical protein R3266_07125 [Gemmatimonadota bacterium]|nr:hypothetical protein [Gemmatimonadota bacterium]